MGPESYRFADLLAAQKQHFWCVLPLTPTRLQDYNSPYQTSSAYAGNPLLISPRRLVEEGFLPKIPPPQRIQQNNRIDFAAVYSQKAVIHDEAYANFKGSGLHIAEFEAFCDKNSHWLNDYALYTALHAKLEVPWQQWPLSLRSRQSEAINRKTAYLQALIEKEKFTQYLFFRQWSHLKNYSRRRHIQILGDMPFYVAYDSADVWVHPELFSLYKNGRPRYVGGVPPDYFSTSGQLWGNPVYNWPQHEETKFSWWIARIRHSLSLCDKLRLDHFRGFVAYWRVLVRAETAKRGHWVEAPADAFFGRVKAAFPSLPFIAEDLGYIDAPVRKAIADLGIPGMKVLLFGFDGSEKNPHLIKNHVANSVVYTGTHDTNTVRGWFKNEATLKERAFLSKLVGKKVTPRTVTEEVVRLAMSSVSDLCIIPFQDVLGLGAKARMNNPGDPFGNWTWRATKKQMERSRIAFLGNFAVEFGRA